MMIYDKKHSTLIHEVRLWKSYIHNGFKLPKIRLLTLVRTSPLVNFTKLGSSIIMINKMFYEK